VGGDPDAIGPSPTGGCVPGERPGEGGDDGHGGHPVPPHGRRARTGKSRELVYDCFGDFEGFVLEDCERRWVYESCERALEEVVRRACCERTRVTVYVHEKDAARPVRIAVHCC